MAMAVRTSFRDRTNDAAATGRREPGWKSLRGITVMGHDLAEKTGTDSLLIKPSEWAGFAPATPRRSRTGPSKRTS